MMNPAPIVLFVYNRPWHTKQTVNALKKNRYASQSDLYIFSDGPKEDQKDSEIKKVREYIQTITGFNSITITERRNNLGLANSTIQGVTEVVNQYDKVIVLEDDLDLSPDFLRFMNASLDHYLNEDQVMQISGHMFNLILETETDAIFLPFTNSIGWATWKRAWDCFDSSMPGYKKLKENKAIRDQFNLDGAYDYFRLLDLQIEGEVESWAIQWYLNVFMNRGMVLYPVSSLIKHIGFGSEATHCRDSDTDSMYAASYSNLPNQDINFPEVSIDQKAFRSIQLFLSSKPTIIGKLKRYIKKEIVRRVKR
jgi:hypothetical protein